MQYEEAIEEGIAAIQAAAAKSRDEYHRSMLSAWGFETEGLSPEDAEAQYREEYADRDLTSEDWEARDQQEGVEGGINLAITALRKLLTDPATAGDVTIYGAGS